MTEIDWAELVKNTSQPCCYPSCSCFLGLAAILQTIFGCNLSVFFGDRWQMVAKETCILYFYTCVGGDRVLPCIGLSLPATGMSDLAEHVDTRC